MSHIACEFVFGVLGKRCMQSLVKISCIVLQLENVLTSIQHPLQAEIEDKLSQNSSDVCKCAL